jgi:hypothetical protein
MALLTIVVTLAYLALAAFGAGGIGAFLARPQFIAISLMTLALTTTALFTVGHIVRYERGDHGNRWRLAAYTDRIGFWTLDGDQLRWFGVLLFAAGGGLRLAPVRNRRAVTRPFREKPQYRRYFARTPAPTRVRARRAK